jgi:hypothetical protein
LDVDEREIGTMLLRLFDASDAGFSLGHHDESVPLEQLTRGSSEVVVVVDEENPTGHETIVPAPEAGRSVAGPTLSSTR